MITHVVIFKLKDKSPEVLKKVKESLESLRDRVPGVRGLETGIDVLKSPRSYDIALTVKFDSLAGLDAYQNHPYHLEVAGYIATVRESVAVVDYEN